MIFNFGIETQKTHRADGMNKNEWKANTEYRKFNRRESSKRSNKVIGSPGD